MRVYKASVLHQMSDGRPVGTHAPESTFEANLELMFSHLPGSSQSVCLPGPDGEGTGTAKLSPAPTLRESADVLFPGTEEIQKAHTHVFAGFAKAQQNQVVADALFGGDSPNDLAKRSEGFDGVLGIVVVPWYPVEVQEREELVSVLLQPLLELQRCFAVQGQFGNPPIKSIHSHQVLPQKAALQTVPINAFDHWLEQDRKCQCDLCHGEASVDTGT